MRAERGSVELPALAGSGVFLAFTLIGTAVAASAQPMGRDFEPERGTLVLPKDCRFERDQARCAADNRAIEFCRNEKDADTVHMCLRANQLPLACSERKSQSARHRCDRINRIYQPCKGKRGPELAACVDERRVKEKRKR